MTTEQLDRAQPDRAPRSPTAPSSPGAPPGAAPRPSLIRAASLSRMVKLEHALFALPFAVSAAVLCAPLVDTSGGRLVPRLVLVLAAMVAARTAAMAMNRLADRAFDARNPRTARRELVTGEVSPAAAWALLVASAVVFVAAAALISPLCGLLAPPVLAVLLCYSYAKRFTWAVHLWLGVAQALGPIGVAVALTGALPLPALVLGLGVGAWVAGLDVLYALQDVEFDREARLHSIPVRFGVAGALRWALGLHTFAAAAVFAAGFLGDRGLAWSAGALLLALVLAVEHAYVAPRGGLRRDRIGAAFFEFNAFASVAFAAFALADLALRGWR